MSSPARLLLLCLLILAGILNYADRQLIAVLKPLLQDTLHWDDSEYGTLTTIFQLATALAFLGTGRIVDRLGWRVANPLAVGSWSLASLAHGAARTMDQFVVARVAMGATVSLGTPAAIKAIAENFGPRQRSIAFGSLNAAGNVGAIVTPLVTPVVALAFGWAGTFLLWGALGFLWLLAWLLFLWAVPAQPNGGQNERRPGGVAAPTLGYVLLQRRTWAIAGGKALSDSVWWFLLFWAPDFFHRTFHLDMQGFALPLALIYAAAAAGAVAGGVVSSRLIARGTGVVEARKVTMLICALLVLLVPAALFVRDYWAAVVILGLTLAAHQGFSVNLFALVSDVTPRSSVATTISIGALCGNLAGMGILHLASEVVGGGGGYGPLLGLSAVVYLLALAWIHWVLPPAQLPSEAELT